jgi:hypothetical protein
MRSAAKVLRQALLGALAVLALTVLTRVVTPAVADDVGYGKVGRWSIVYRDAGSSNSCSAIATFADQTLIQLALVQTRSEKAWAIFLSNPQWDSWIGERTQATLFFLTTKLWQSDFIVTTSEAGEKKMLVRLVSSAFVDSIADASTMVILNDQKQQVSATLDMKDSGDAIAAATQCVRQHPLGGAPGPQSDKGALLRRHAALFSRPF